MFYITGDTHGKFSHIELFCNENNTTKDDTLIILGDAGINYYGNKRDIRLKRKLANLPIKLFCIHGNHEMRPRSINTYQKIDFNGGKVFVEPDYPNLMFAKDGDVYHINGLKCIVLGGAYSIDKHYRLLKGYHWFSDEQPDDRIKQTVKEQLEKINDTVDIVLSHTCPLKYEPTEVFLDFIDQSTVDKSTEQWLDEIENKLKYQKWYCGHYHTSKTINKLEFVFQNIIEFTM